MAVSRTTTLLFPADVVRREGRDQVTYHSTGLPGAPGLPMGVSLLPERESREDVHVGEAGATTRQQPDGWTKPGAPSERALWRLFCSGPRERLGDDVGMRASVVSAAHRVEVGNILLYWAHSKCSIK